jgi:hypothetical protein
MPADLTESSPELVILHQLHRMTFDNALGQLQSCRLLTVH